MDFGQGMGAIRGLVVLCLVALAAPSQAGSPATLGRWLIDDTNSRLLLPYQTAAGHEDVWTNGLDVVFEAEGAPSPGAPSTTTTSSTTTMAASQQPELNAAELSPVPVSGKKSKLDLELAQWYSVGYDALSHEAAGSRVRLVKLLTIWMEHESDFETRKQISKQLEELEDATSFLQVARSALRMRVQFDDVEPVTLRQLQALERAHSFVGAKAQAALAADGTAAEHISVPQVVGDSIPDAANMISMHLGGKNWVAILPLKSGKPAGKTPWRRVSAQGAQGTRQVAPLAAPQQLVPKSDETTNSGGSISLSLKPVYQEQKQDGDAASAPQPSPAQQPAQQSAPRAPPPPQAASSAGGSSYMNELNGALDGDDAQQAAPRPRPALRAASQPTTPSIPIVRPQPKAPVTAMVDSTGPDADGSSQQTRMGKLTSFADSMPAVDVPETGKAGWLNWKPADDSKQVSGMLQQLGMLKGAGAAKAVDPNMPAFAKDDIDSDSDSPSSSSSSSSFSAPSALSPPPTRVASWASLVPKNLRRNAPAPADDDSEPAPRPRPVARKIEFPVMPTEPMTQQVEQAVAMPQMSSGGGGDQLEMLKHMNPESYNIVKALLAKKAAGMAIPGLTQREKPAEDPAIAALGQINTGVALGADSSSSSSSSTGLAASSSSSSSTNSDSSYGSSASSSSGSSDSSATSSYGSNAGSGYGSSDSSATSSYGSNAGSGYGSSASSYTGATSSFGSSASSDSSSINAMNSLDASTNAIMNADATSSSSAESSYGGSSYGGSSYGSNSYAGAAPPSKLTNYKAPAPSGDVSAVNGLLEEVARLTGKHVGGQKKEAESSSNQPAFMHDFDDDNSGGGASAPRASRGWGDLIPGHHQDQGQDSQLQESAAPPAPAANPYASLLN